MKRIPYLTAILLVAAFTSAAEPKKEPKQPVKAISVVGVLVDADGAVVKEQSIVAYPLDPSGKPLDLAGMKNGSVVAWNPMATTDAKGRFSFSLPRVRKVGDDPITRYGFGLPTRGSGVSLFTGIVLPMECAGRETEHVIVAKADLSLLRSGAEVATVGTADDVAKVDLGSLAIQ